MARIRPTLILTLSLALGAAAAALAPIDARPALAGDANKDLKEAEKLKKRRDAFREKLKKEGKFPFYDLSYAADQKACKESRWSQTDPPPVSAADLSEEKGHQFWATWSVDVTKGQGIEIRVIKMLHKPSPTQKGVYEFKKIGQTVDVADDGKMIQGFYDETRKEFTNLVEAKCVKPTKKSIGPTKMFCSIFGTNTESQKRERKDFYVWTGPNTTWLTIVTFSDKYLDEPGILDKAAEFIGTWRELKAPD